ncbi:MAG: hypothetical protein ABSH14_15740 [Verrucomicrobiia bacterium]|jgi:hypothetical protein
MKKSYWVIAALSITTALLAVVVVKQRQELAVMSERTPVVRMAERPKTRTSPIHIAPKPMSALSAETTPPSVLASPMIAPAPSGDTKPSFSTGTASNWAYGLAGMMNNPQMKEVLQAQQKAMVEPKYGSLSKDLNLSADQLDALKSLIADRQAALMDARLPMIGGSEADRKQAMENVNAIRAEYDQKIKDLLGPQDYQTFQDYEKTSEERSLIQMFKGSLPADAALTDQQEYDLLNSMYEARTSLPSSSLLYDPSKLTEENVGEAIKQFEVLEQAYAERAKSILSPAQYDQFIQSEQQISGLAAVSFKMQQQMFGSKSAPTLAPSQSSNP